MNKRNLIAGLALALVVTVGIVLWYASSRSKSGNKRAVQDNPTFPSLPSLSPSMPTTVNLNRKDFENGVAYPSPEFMVTAQVGCNFDDWKVTVAWGDGITETLTHTVQPTLPGPTTKAGSYPWFSSHAYGQTATYTATAQLFVHCAGTSPGSLSLMDSKSWTTTVYDRLPLMSLSASAASIARGASVTMTSQTYADAPLSGTRVTLSTTVANVFGPGTLATNSVINAHSRTTTTTLSVSPTAPLGNVTITATAGNQLTKTVKIIP
jgi:hypothetical protein